MLVRQLTIFAMVIFVGCGKSNQSGRKLQDERPNDNGVQITEPFASVYGQKIIASFFGKCTEVINGDVIEVKTESGKTIRVRMESVDAPELDQPFGECASEYVETSLLNKHLKIAITGEDEQGRSRGWVLMYPDGRNQAIVVTNFNALLVKEGLAWHYNVHADSEMIRNLENQAREAKAGLWKDDDPVEPWKWRKRKRNAG